MCSGKDTVAEIFIKKGYKKISISEDILKPILSRLKLKPDRLNYIKLGRALKEFKPETLAFLTHGLINKGKGHNYIIPNIMTFQEARYLKEQSDIKFILIKIIADQMTRYERNLQRQNEKDVNELIKFKRLDMANLTKTGLKELMHAKLENAVINNDSGLSELKSRVNKLIEEFGL